MDLSAFKIQIRELAIPSNSRDVVSVGSLFRRSEIAEELLFLANGRTPWPGTWFVTKKLDALVWLAAIPLLRPVRNVLCMAANTEIGAAVVQPIAIDVIYMLSGLGSRNKPMQKGAIAIGAAAPGVSQTRIRDSLDVPLPSNYQGRICLVHERNDACRPNGNFNTRTTPLPDQAEALKLVSK